MRVIEMLARYGAKAAIVSGALAGIGLVFLLLFYALEAPSLIERGTTDVWVPLGRTNDALVGLAALAAIPVAARFHTSWRRRAPGPSTVAVTLAILAMLAIGVTQSLYAAALIPSALQSTLIGVLFIGLGVWLVAVSVGGAYDSPGRPVRWLGAGVGVGYVLVAITALAYASSGSGDPAAIFANPFLAAAAGLGLLASQFGYPIWAISLGRRLLREDAGAGG